MTLMPLAPSTLSCLDVRRGAHRQTSDRLPTRPPLDALQAGVGLGNFPALPRSDGAPIYIYSVHVRTRKFRNLAETKRYVVPAPTANSKTQGGTRIDSDSICHRCHRHQSVFSGFLTV